MGNQENLIEQAANYPAPRDNPILYPGDKTRY